MYTWTNDVCMDLLMYARIYAWIYRCMHGLLIYIWSIDIRVDLLMNTWIYYCTHGSIGVCIYHRSIEIYRNLLMHAWIYWYIHKLIDIYVNLFIYTWIYWCIHRSIDVCVDLLMYMWIYWNMHITVTDSFVNHSLNKNEQGNCGLLIWFRAARITQTKTFQDLWHMHSLNQGLFEISVLSKLLWVTEIGPSL